MEDLYVSGTVAAKQFCDQIVIMFVSHTTRDVFYHCHRRCVLADAV